MKFTIHDDDGLDPHAVVGTLDTETATIFPGSYGAGDYEGRDLYLMDDGRWALDTWRNTNHGVAHHVTLSWPAEVRDLDIAGGFGIPTALKAPWGMVRVDGEAVALNSASALADALNRRADVFGFDDGSDTGDDTGWMLDIEHRADASTDEVLKTWRSIEALDGQTFPGLGYGPMGSRVDQLVLWQALVLRDALAAVGWHVLIGRTSLKV